MRQRNQNKNKKSTSANMQFAVDLWMITQGARHYWHVTNQLLQEGVAIDQLNVIRKIKSRTKHLSHLTFAIMKYW